MESFEELFRKLRNEFFRLKGEIARLESAAPRLTGEERRLFLTDAEREAVRRASRIFESREAMEKFTADDAGALLGLLERLA